MTAITHVYFLYTQRNTPRRILNSTHTHTCDLDLLFSDSNEQGRRADFVGWDSLSLSIVWILLIRNSLLVLLDVFVEIVSHFVARFSVPVGIGGAMLHGIVFSHQTSQLSRSV